MEVGKSLSEEINMSKLMARGWGYKGIVPPANWEPWCFQDNGEGFCNANKSFANTPITCLDCPRLKVAVK